MKKALFIFFRIFSYGSKFSKHQKSGELGNFDGNAQNVSGKVKYL